MSSRNGWFMYNTVIWRTVAVLWTLNGLAHPVHSLTNLVPLNVLFVGHLKEQPLVKWSRLDLHSEYSIYVYICVYILDSSIQHWSSSMSLNLFRLTNLSLLDPSINSSHNSMLLLYQCHIFPLQLLHSPSLALPAQIVQLM